MVAGNFRCVLWVLVLCGCGRSSPYGLTDGGPTTTDGRARDRSLQPDRGAPSCSILAAYAVGQRISTASGRRAALSPSLARLALVTHKDNAPGDLQLIPLQAGPGKTLATHVSRVQWLAHNRGLLALKVHGQSSSVPYDLLHFAADGSAGRALAAGLCGHLAVPDGSRVYVVGSCDYKQRGKLQVVDLKSGVINEIAPRVSASSLAVSPNGRWAAFVSELNPDPTCNQPTGRCQVVDAAGKKRMLTSKALDSTTQFTPTNVLLLRTTDGCSDPKATLLAADLGSGNIRKLTLQPHFNYHGYFVASAEPYGTWRYAVSPDGTLLLVAQILPGNSNELLAINIATGGTRVLATDLYPYQMISLAFRVWSFAAGGQYVVYASTSGKYPTMGLTALPVAGGKPVQLSKNMHIGAHDILQESGHVAWVEGTGPGVYEVMYASLISGVRYQVHQVKQLAPGYLRLVPGGRGVMLVEHSDSSTKLIHATASGARELGRWKLQSYFADSYMLDPRGCAVVFNQDRGTPAGAYLRQIVD